MKSKYLSERHIWETLDTISKRRKGEQTKKDSLLEQEAAGAKQWGESHSDVEHWLDAAVQNQQKPQQHQQPETKAEESKTEETKVADSGSTEGATIKFRYWADNTDYSQLMQDIIAKFNAENGKRNHCSW